MAQFEWVHAAWLALAIVLEIVANVFLKFSDGFRRKTTLVAGIVLIKSGTRKARKPELEVNHGAV
ncbi:SMR family transporter [Shigella flexneri]